MNRIEGPIKHCVAALRHSPKTLALLLTAFFVGTTAFAAGTVDEIKVMSFNIWVNGGHSLAKCIEAIRVSGADVVGLQESNPGTTQNIATNLGFHYVPNVPIISRFPIEADLKATGGSGVTILVSTHQRIHFFNCHLTAYPYGPYDLKDGKSRQLVLEQEDKTRMPMLKKLLAAMAGPLKSSEPCFLTGDFNAPSHLDYKDMAWPTSLACAEAGLVDSYKETHPNGIKHPEPFVSETPGITWTPLTSEEPHGVFDRIDFVYYSSGDGLKPMASTELDGRNCVSPWPSDHRAVITTFKFPPSTEAHEGAKTGENK